jgi:hypothetical protein
MSSVPRGVRRVCPWRVRPRGPFLSSPLRLPPGLEEWRGEQRILPPRGQSLPQGAKLRMGLWRVHSRRFRPRGRFRPLGVKTPPGRQINKNNISACFQKMAKPGSGPTVRSWSPSTSCRRRRTRRFQEDLPWSLAKSAR